MTISFVQFLTMQRYREGRMGDVARVAYGDPDRPGRRAKAQAWIDWLKAWGTFASTQTRHATIEDYAALSELWSEHWNLRRDDLRKMLCEHEEAITDVRRIRGSMPLSALNLAPSDQQDALAQVQ